ncbi:glycoside hydrolase/deacetylase [Dentipellis sp. KUC8613]|nr:glycoside hydrolase/deacetylase [Dentipellis sp. KUC8613]
MRIQSLLTDTRPMRALLVASLALGAAAQDRTTEQGEAQIKDPNAECTPYYYAPSGNAIHNFPPIWTPATILSNDTEAQQKWQNISGSIPTNIQPKGSNMGDFSNVSYTSADPDCWWTYGKCTTPKLAGLAPDVSSVPEPKTMGYGFDDGPNCSHNAFYDFLQQNNQKATMFFIGSNVMDWPLEAQRALTDGHEICVHTWSHRYMTSFQSQDAFAELWYTMKAIKLVTGVTPTCWRPPFGDVDDRIRAIANALNLQTIIWKYDSNDWRAGTGGVTPADVDANYTSFISNVASGTFNTEGGIMLTHELNNFTMSEAVKFYPQLQAAFSHIVPVGVALNKSQPYVETNYTLPSFAEYISGTTNKTGSANSSSSGGGSSSGSGGNNNGGSSSGAQKKSAAVASARPVVPALVLAGAGLLASLAL